MPSHLLSRQSSSDDDNDSWWWSTPGIAIRYAIALAIILLLLAYFVGGRVHAQRRLARGQPPLPYHAWMVRRTYAMQQASLRGQNPYYNSNSNGIVAGRAGVRSYAMPQREAPYDLGAGAGGATYAPPPPAYEAPPPTYQPPEGGSKVLADQRWREVGGEEEEQGSSSRP